MDFLLGLWLFHWVPRIQKGIQGLLICVKKHRLNWHFFYPFWVLPCIISTLCISQYQQLSNSYALYTDAKPHKEYLWFMRILVGSWWWLPLERGLNCADLWLGYLTVKLIWKVWQILYLCIEMMVWSSMKRVSSFPTPQMYVALFIMRIYDENIRVILHVGCFLYLLENLILKRQATAVKSHLGNPLLCHVKPRDKINLLIEICLK